MWIFTKNGFFSAVQHLDLPDCLLVRARLKGDLNRFITAHNIKTLVQVTPNADYRYRAIIKKTDFAKAVEAEAESIDYSNFKNAVHDGTPRDTAYMKCWSAMVQAQEREE